MVFGTHMFQIWAQCLDFEGAKNIYVLQVLFIDCGEGWRILTWVWHLGHDLDIVTGFIYTYIPNFGSLS